MSELTTIDDLNELPIGSVILCDQRAWTRLEPHPSQLMTYPALVTWGCPDGGFVRQGNQPDTLLPAQLLFTPTPNGDKR